MMRLAYVLGMYPQPSEMFIAREIAGLRTRGHLVTVFSLFSPAGESDPTTIYGWKTPLQRAWRKVAGHSAISALARDWRQQIAGNYDAILAHFASIPSTVALQMAADLPLILSVHARDLYVEAECLAEKIARARAVVTCTQANIDYLCKMFPSFSERFHLLYHGLPQSWLTAPPPARIRQHGEPVRFLAAGRFVAKKGFAVLLDACAHLAQTGFSFKLRIIGDGPLQAELLRQRNSRHLQSLVSFEPWRDELAMRTAYAWADVFCCPSIIAEDGDRDGLPNVVVEAMSTALPIVAARVSGLPEAVEDGISGLLVPSGDPVALAKCLARQADPIMRKSYGEHSQRIVQEKFDGERSLGHLECLLQVVLH